MNVVEDDLITALREFDLEESDAFLYLTLLQTGPTTVNSLSVKLDMEKTKVYRSLHRMQNLGIITSTFCNPTICDALDPQMALSKIIEKKQGQITSMQKILQKISSEITRLGKFDGEKPQIPTFNIIQGRTNIYTRIGNMIQDSSDTVYITAPFSDVRRMSYTVIPDKIKSYTENHGDVILITDDNMSDEMTDITLNASEVKAAILPSNGRTVVSGDSLIMSGNLSPSMKLNDESDTAFYTNSKGIIDSVQELCKHLHKTSVPIINLTR